MLAHKKKRVVLANIIHKLWIFFLQFFGWTIFRGNHEHPNHMHVPYQLSYSTTFKLNNYMIVNKKNVHKLLKKLCISRIIMSIIQLTIHLYFPQFMDNSLVDCHFLYYHLMLVNSIYFWSRHCKLISFHLSILILLYKFKLFPPSIMTFSREYLCHDLFMVFLKFELFF